MNAYPGADRAVLDAKRRHTVQPRRSCSLAINSFGLTIKRPARQQSRRSCATFSTGMLPCWSAVTMHSPTLGAPIARNTAHAIAPPYASRMQPSAATYTLPLCAIRSRGSIRRSRRRPTASPARTIASRRRMRAWRACWKACAMASALWPAGSDSTFTLNHSRCRSRPRPCGVHRPLQTTTAITSRSRARDTWYPSILSAA